jgi:hypothetical protein
MRAKLCLQALFARHRTRSVYQRPAFHDAVEFEPQIVMEAARRVLSE